MANVKTKTQRKHTKETDATHILLSSASRECVRHFHKRVQWRASLLTDEVCRQRSFDANQRVTMQTNGMDPCFGYEDPCISASEHENSKKSLPLSPPLPSSQPPPPPLHLPLPSPLHLHFHLPSPPTHPTTHPKLIELMLCVVVVCACFCFVVFGVEEGEGEGDGREALEHLLIIVYHFVWSLIITSIFVEVSNLLKRLNVDAPASTPVGVLSPTVFSRLHGVKQELYERRVGDPICACCPSSQHPALGVLHEDAYFYYLLPLGGVGQMAGGFCRFSWLYQKLVSTSVVRFKL